MEDDRHMLAVLVLPLIGPHASYRTDPVLPRPRPIMLTRSTLRQFSKPSLSASAHVSAQTPSSAAVLDIFNVSPFLQQPAPQLPLVSKSLHTVFEEHRRNGSIAASLPSSLPPPVVIDGPSRSRRRHLSSATRRPKRTMPLRTPPVPRTMSVVAASKLPIEVFDGPARRMTRTPVSLSALMLTCAVVIEGCFFFRTHRDLAIGSRQHHYDEFILS